MEDKKLISVVVPCYNEQEVLPIFYKEIIKLYTEKQNKYPETVSLFIDDESKVCTLRMMLARTVHRIYAVLSNAKDDLCVAMDADLHHLPAFLTNMYEAIQSRQYDCATTRKINHSGESMVRSLFAKMLDKIVSGKNFRRFPLTLPIEILDRTKRLMIDTPIMSI